ncbi:MAG TPA: MMPL family transporter, partial [Capillimicrobium sp.]
AYLFPNRDSALVQVRLKPGLSEQERSDAVALIREAVAMDRWRLTGGGRYVTTGAPVVLDDLGDAISESLLVLLLAALLVMAATLALVFRARLRMLPLLIALCASALTFAGLALAGLPLTMASIGVLPVLIGLAVDYAIQFQSRTAEEGSPVRAARLGAPTIATAGAATAAGFAVLALSPVPMVRQFGLLLVAGVLVALALTITAGTAALTLVGRRAPATTGPLGALAAAARGAEALVSDNAAARWARGVGARAGSGLVALGLAHGRRLLAVAAVLAVAGWALDTQADVESDINRLVPQDLQALQDLRDLQETTGIGGQIDVMVTADDLTDPEVIAWMGDYQRRILRRYDYSADRGCGQATVCPSFSLTDLLDPGSSGEASAADIQALLDAVPPYFSQAVITNDRQAATLAFGIRLMPLDEQQDVIEAMRSELDPPEGVEAELAGLPVLAADANAQVSEPWRRIALLVGGLLAVALVLLVALRSVRRALLPLVPIALATGWSSLVLFALQVELNPMSVTLGALVVAISTEFSVLLAERYRQEREGGHDPRAALERTYRSTGAAVLASGATAIAGFAVLIVSDVQMLRDFGWVTVIDLAVSLLGVLVVLPAVLVAAEGASLPRRRAAREAPAA